MAKRLVDTIHAQENISNQHSEKRTVGKIVSKDGTKDKQISAKVNVKMYNAFTIINRAQGLSNNSALNMLISKYVRENRMLLDNEDIE